jgi:DNA mismatch repair protein MSH4
VKQLGEKHDLPVKSAYNSTRGFHAQMHVNNKDNLSIEELPSQFIKVVKTKNVLAFTTADLVSCNCLANDLAVPTVPIKYCFFCF